MKESEIKERKYIRSEIPLDKDALSKALIIGKGEGRTMEKYAEACGSSSATFHRIANGNFKKPLSDELIRAIVANAFDGRLELDEVMRANGKIPLEEMSPDEYDRDFRNRMAHGLKIINSVWLSRVEEIIKKSLYEKDYLLMAYQRLPLENREDFPRGRFGLSYSAGPESFAIHLKGYEPFYWYFILNKNDLNEPDAQSTDISSEQLKYREDRMLWESMNQMGKYFLKDIWEPETMSKMKVTFVFTKKTGYDVLKNALKDRKVNGFFSLLLIDAINKEIVEEFILQRFNGKNEVSLFGPFDIESLGEE